MRRQKRQDQILDSSVRLFFERGFDKLSVSDLADAMGVSRGTFYLHFKSKRDVFLALTGRFQEEILKTFSSHSVVFQSLGGVDLYAVSSILFKHRYFLAVVLSQGHTLEEDLLRQAQIHLRMMNDALENGIKALVARGIFRSVDVHLAALSITGLVKEMIFQFVRDDDETVLGAHTRFLLDIVLRSFLSRPVVATATNLITDRFLSPLSASEFVYS